MIGLWLEMAWEVCYGIRSYAWVWGFERGYKSL